MKNANGFYEVKEMPKYAMIQWDGKTSFGSIRYERGMSIISCGSCNEETILMNEGMTSNHSPKPTYHTCQYCKTRIIL